jgi:transcription elongation factor B subunit 1
MTTAGKDNNNPGCETPKDMYVKLISSDGHEFYIKRDLALTSQTIKAMLSGPGLFFYFSIKENISFPSGQYAENETNAIHFRSISSQVRKAQQLV